MVYCDANIILRYLLRDNSEQYNISADIIEKKDNFLLNEVTAKIVYVLLKTYKEYLNLIIKRSKNYA